MKKVNAVLRSLVLLFILVMTLWGLPFEVFGSGESMVKVERIRKLVMVVGIGILWIGIGTAIAWFQALRKPKAPKVKAGKEPPAPGQEPAAEKPAAESKEAKAK